LLIYLLLTQFNNYFTGEFINIFIGIFSYLIFRFFWKKYNLLFFLKISKLMIFITVVILTLDTIYRLLHPTAPTLNDLNIINNSPNLWFYKYKFGTLLFADSNTVALVSLILFFYIKSLENLKIVNKKYFKSCKKILFIVLISTFSRAAIISFFIGLSYIYLKKINDKLIKILIIFFIIIFFVFTAVLFSNFVKDGSLESKFFILYQFINILPHLSVDQIIFGIGLGKAEDYLGIYTHIIYITYLLEIGIIGFLLFIFFIIYYFYKYNDIILIPFLIVSFSYFLYLGTPFLFIPLALSANIIDCLYKLER